MKLIHSMTAKKVGVTTVDANYGNNSVISSNMVIYYQTMSIKNNIIPLNSNLKSLYKRHLIFM